MNWILAKCNTDACRLHRGVMIGEISKALQQLDTAGAWQVQVKRYRRSRTMPQNSKFHAMCQELGTEIGYTAGEIKRLVKNELGAYELIAGPVGKIKRMQSSADWNTEQMAQAIELLQRWAAEVGHRWSAEP